MTEQTPPQPFDDDAVAEAAALTVEQVDAQIREAETLHRSLTEQLRATAEE